MGPMGDMPGQQEASKMPMQCGTTYNNYKTVRCRLFDNGKEIIDISEGFCRFGEKCTYAHGDEELRNPHDAIIVPVNGQLPPSL
jgi:hypothetical protein